MAFGFKCANYFDTAFNKLQIPTFIGVLVYVVHEFAWPYEPSVQLYFGITLSFLLWVLSLQYLEVHSTAGYLIPMMRGMAADLSRFLAFYWPFQCAYTCAYFLLFQALDEPTYNTVGHAFVTTFLVMLGQINLDAFENLTDGSYVLGYVLLLSHATLTIVMLLNVLVAMMTKTVDGGLDQAKLEALVSFAECVLRSEKTIGLVPITYEPPVAKEDAKAKGIQTEDGEVDQCDEASDEDEQEEVEEDDEEFVLHEVSMEDRLEALEEKLTLSNNMNAETQATLAQVLALVQELQNAK